MNHAARKAATKSKATTTNVDGEWAAEFHGLGLWNVRAQPMDGAGNVGDASPAQLVISLQ